MTVDQAPLSDFKSGSKPPSSLKQLSLNIKFYIGSLFYLTYAIYAYRYSFTRDRVERQFLAEPTSAVTNVGALLRIESTVRGVSIYFEQAELEMTFLKSDFALFNWKPGLQPIPYGLAKPINGADTQQWAGVTITLDQMPDGWMISSSDLRIYIDQTGSIRLYNATGQLLREELPPQRRGDAWSHAVRLRPEENIYGLGERAAALNLRSPNITARKPSDDKLENPTQHSTQHLTQHPTQTYRMWNYDAAGMYAPGSDPMYIGIPLYLSLHQQGSYLVFYENSFESTFKLDEQTITADFTGGALRYYIAVGSPAQVLERYTELTGRSPLPPLWALGYHQSRWGYRTEEAVRETAQQFRDLDLPLSAIHLDIDVQVGYRAFTLDPNRFPRLGKFTQELASQGIQFITILNPGIKYSRKSKLFLEGRMLEAFCKLPDGNLAVAPVWCGWSVFPDFTDPQVRQWWSRQYEFLLDLGVAGFWHDMNEPAAFIAWGDRSLPKVTLHKLEGRGGDHREAHNVYGLLQARAAFESLCQYRPQQRPFIVSRSGWAGLQRYAWTWTGDIECTWDCLYQTIATVIGLGLSGIPYSGPDIGGFQGNPSAELYVRWFQMATFLPFYRSHCSNNVEYRAPWTYGEPYLSILRGFLKLRYQLMPYFYTLAWEATQKGYPLVRPLFWYHTDDSSFWGVDDAFYLGESLLVYPVLEDRGRSRQVLLPAGVWYSFWDDRTYTGTTQVELSAPLEQIPLLVKAGTVLPMTRDHLLILHLYPPAEDAAEDVGEGFVYSDAGDGYGEWRLDRFRLVRFAEGLELFWEQHGDYPLLYKFPYKGIAVCFHGFQPTQSWIDGTESPIEVSLQDLRAKIHCEFTGQFRQAFFKGEFLT